LSKADLNKSIAKIDGESGGHAVLLVSYSKKSLRFVNSWGSNWANGGFFEVENEHVLGDLKFCDVYWTL